MQDPSKLTFFMLAALAASTAVAVAQTTAPTLPPVLPPSIGSPETPGGGNPGTPSAPGQPVPSAPEPAAPATPATPAPTAVPVQFDGALEALAEAPYSLGPGDSVNVQVFNVPEYSGTFLVGVDGQLRIPLVGSFDVDGLTLDELANILMVQLEPVVQRPIVTVDLAQPRPIRVAISGEIAAPGSYTLDGFFPPLSEVVRGAGGITQAADVRRIRLTRVVRGNPEEIEIDLFDLLAAGNLDLDIRLRDNDRIFIPTVPAPRPDEARLIVSSTVAGEAATGPAEVAVVGQVVRPGTHTVTGAGDDRPPTVTAALQAAGGITNRSDLRAIFVRRPTRVGEEQIIPANLWETLIAGDLSQDIILQPGDTIVVPKAAEIIPAEEADLASASFAPGTIAVNFIGEVNNQGRLEIPSNTPLSQAVLAAGSFQRGRARSKSVRLIRLNSNGTVTERRIDVDFEAPIDSAENPTLRNNDTVIVGRNVLAQVTDTVDVILTPFFRVFSILNTIERLND